jgi:hypothetical protein
MMTDRLIVFRVEIKVDLITIETIEIKATDLTEGIKEMMPEMTMKRRICRDSSLVTLTTLLMLTS